MGSKDNGGVVRVDAVARRVIGWLFAVLFAAGSAAAQAQLADLVINIADDPDPGPAGGLYTYTVRVDNNGPNPTTDVSLVQTLPTSPAAAVFVSATATQGSCSNTPTQVTCALGSIAFPGFAAATIVVRLPISGVYQSVFTATSALPDPNTSNNLDIPESTTARDAADMGVVVSGPALPVAAGANYNLQVTATNHGPNALGASDTREIAFTVPGGACVTSAPSGSGWACTAPGPYPVCSGGFTCNRTGALAVNASDPVLTVPMVANSAGTITAAFDVSSSLPDGNPDNDTGVADVEVLGGSSDLAITKTVSPTGTVAQGSNVTYTLTPRFNGGVPPGSTGDGVITITDTLPAGLTFGSVTPNVPWTCAYSAPTVTCTMNGPYLGGNFTNLPTIAIVAQVATEGAIPNTATIDGPENDPNLLNNASTVSVTGSNRADLTVTKTASLPAVVPNQPLTYTIRPRNSGPLAMVAGQTVTITDTLPAGLTLTANPSNANWTCTVAPPATMPPPDAPGPLALTCVRVLPANVAANTNLPTITVSTFATATGTIDNTACGDLTGPGPQDDSTTRCGSVSVVSTGSASSADLSISKSGNPATVKAGELLTYTLSVHNAGPGAATNVVVTDALSSLFASGPGLVSAAVTAGTGTCSPAGPSSVSSTTVTCTIPTLASGADATVTIQIRPSIAATGTRTNQASVNSTQVGDPDRSNNTSSTVTTSVTAVADMQVTKTANPASVPGGAPLTYVMTARNNGPSNAENVTVTDTLPANAVFLSLTSTGTCTTPAVGATGGTISCTFGTVNAGVQRTATYVVRPLGSAAGGNVVNQVVVSTATEDTNGDNNSASVITPVVAPLLDILVNKVDSVDPVALGATTRYTITITNQGPSYGTNLRMVDAFPSQSPTATFSWQGNLDVQPPGSGTCATVPAIGATTGTLECAFAGIAAGQVYTVAYDMRAESVVSGISGTGFNQVDVTVDETETHADNNRAIESTTTRRTADLSIIKTGPDVLTPGASFDYTIVVTNLGPNPSAGAIVTDTLPAPLTLASAGPGCTNVGPAVTCTLGTLGLNETATITIRASVPYPYTGPASLTNTATVAAVNEIDPVPENNTDDATGAVDTNAPPPLPPSQPVPTLPWQGLVALAAMLAAAGGWQRRRLARSIAVAGPRR